MNRWGFLLGETVIKIVIAVICIGFLIYLLASLYYNSANDEKVEFAKASLEHIVGAEREVDIYNPEGWVLISWPYDNQIPNFCSNLGWGNCLCICEDTLIRKSAKNYVSRCDDEGVCLENDFKVEGNKIKIEDVPLILEVKDGVIKEK